MPAVVVATLVTEVVKTVVGLVFREAASDAPAEKPQAKRKETGSSSLKEKVKRRPAARRTSTMSSVKVKAKASVKAKARLNININIGQPPPRRRSLF